MSRHRKRQFRFVSFTILPAILIILAALVPAYLAATDDAGAINATEWETVRSALDGYVTGQYQAGAEGEAGFVIESGDVMARINSNGDATILGEGDDVANAPVLVDVLSGNATWIPGTSVRGNWNSTSVSSAVVDQISAEVDQHQAAGIGTDVVVYCATGHTEAVVTGAYGAISGAGGLGGDNPKVVALKWGRNGWTNAPKTYSNANALGAAGAKSTYANATQSDATCNGKTGAELVRCVAERATLGTAGNVSNGVNPPLGDVQPVDVRTPSPSSTINNAPNAATIQIPINTLFNTGLNYLNPAATPKKIFASRTQHVGGIAAVGAEMLGYDSGFLQWGMPNWNNTLDEKQVTNLHPNYALVSTAEDETAPSQSAAGHSNVNQTTADISRTTNEPATMKIEYGTTTAYGEVVNKTVLKSGARTETLSGLTAGTTYYYRVTSYDGMANASASATGSFTTSGGGGGDDTEDPVVTYVGPTGTISNDSPTVTGTATDNVGVASVSLSLDGGEASDCTVNGSGDVTCPTSGLVNGEYSAVIAAYDAAGNSGTAEGSFTVASGTPELTLETIDVYWASYADYTNGQLSVDMRVNNTGEGPALGTTVTKVTATNGVTLSTTLPLALGDISGGGFLDFTLVYTVPEGVASFSTDVFAECQDTAGEEHYYPYQPDDEDPPASDMFQAKWDELNGAPGEPTGDIYDIPGGQARDYQNGRLIYCESHDKVYWIHGAILAKYDAIGGPNSFLSLPDSDPYSYGIGMRSDFHGGYIYSTPYFTIAVPNQAAFSGNYSGNWSAGNLSEWLNWLISLLLQLMRI